MTAQIISGTEVAKQIREELKQEIAELKEKHNLVPGLVTVLVGEDPASQVYVGQKEKTSVALGIYSERHDLPAETSEEELLNLIGSTKTVLPVDDIERVVGDQRLARRLVVEPEEGGQPEKLLTELRQAFEVWELKHRLGQIQDQIANTSLDEREDLTDLMRTKRELTGRLQELRRGRR